MRSEKQISKLGSSDPRTKTHTNTLLVWTAEESDCTNRWTKKKKRKEITSCSPGNEKLNIHTFRGRFYKSAQCNTNELDEFENFTYIKVCTCLDEGDSIFYLFDGLHCCNTGWIKAVVPFFKSDSGARPQRFLSPVLLYFNKLSQCLSSPHHLFALKLLLRFTMEC